MYMRHTAKIIAVLAIAVLVAPFGASAATPAYKPAYGGWLPFWKEASGANEVMAHLDRLAYFSPFSYELDAEIGVTDVMNVDESPWPELFALARKRGVKIVPTIANFDPDLLHALLSDPERRKSHIEDILGTIILKNYDGIDIDYENKRVETKPYFSTFIKELATVLHSARKVLACTVEPRTPLSSRFNVTRPPVEYANDYAVLNKYCDEVRIMAYDQGNIDVKLNKSKGSIAPYFPVADPAWVEKVIQEALGSISRSKLVLGIPTYGYEFQMQIANIATTTATSTGTILDQNGSNLPATFSIPTQGWIRARSVTYAQALQLATSTNSRIIRNAAGELSFVYATTSPSLGVPVIRVAWFTDAQSINEKVSLVRKYRLKGAYLFKFDGEGDQNFWNLLR